MPEELSDQTLAEGINELAPSFSMIRRLLAVLEDPNSDIADISRIVRVDPVLTAQVLHLVNGASYGLGGGITSIEEAIQQTGQDEVARLASTLSARQLSSRSADHYRVSSSLLWQHTLAVAVAAELLAERFLLDTEAAYLSGLLHTLGITALDAFASRRGLPPLTPGSNARDWEAKWFGTDNASVCARILEILKLPAVFVTSVGTRYQTPDRKSLAESKGLLYLASALAEKVPAGLPPETGMFAVGEELLDALRIDPDDWSQLSLTTGQNLSRLKALYDRS